MSLNIQLPDFSIQELIEKVADQSPGTVSISLDGAESNVVYQLPYEKRYDATVFILGAAWVDYISGGGAVLRRLIPLRHPSYPNLYARKLSYTGKKFIGKETTGENLPEWKRQDETSMYSIADFNVEFSPLYFKVYTDDEVYNPDTGEYEEWERFCRLYYQPAPDLITIENGSFLWAEGPKTGQATPANISYPERKADITLKWLFVPQEYTHNADGVPVKIEACIGKLNNATTFGRAAGTLLLDSVEFEPVTIPLVTDDWQAYFANHVTLKFKFFDPPNGDPGSSIRGHNLLPDRGADNTWSYYYATNDGTMTGKPLYDSTDFYEMFRYWGA
jgi:hypothetical protein